MPSLYFLISCLIVFDNISIFALSNFKSAIMNLLLTHQQRFYKQCEKTLRTLNREKEIDCANIPADVVEHLIRCGAMMEDNSLFACVKSAKAERCHYFESLYEQATLYKWKILGVKTSLLISILAFIVSVCSLLVSLQ